MYIDAERKPDVFSAANYVAAVVLHAALFFALWYIGTMDTTPKELAIPIDLMVVAHENLDGVDDEPPPEDDAPPEPEPEPPQPEPTPPPPPPPEEVIAVTPPKEEKKPDPPKEEKKPEPPPKEVKPTPPKPPEETPEQKRQKRIEEMRKSTTKVNNPPKPPHNNGRTEQKPPNLDILLNEGYNPGPVNLGLDASDEARCALLIKRAFHDKWTDRPAWTDQLRTIVLSVRFGPGGKVLGYEISKSSGDRAADQTVLRAASQVGAVRGLSSAYIEHNPTVKIQFTVTP